MTKKKKKKGYGKKNRGRKPKRKTGKYYYARFGKLTKRQDTAIQKFNRALGAGISTTEAMLKTHGYTRRKAGYGVK